MPATDDHRPPPDRAPLALAPEPQAPVDLDSTWLQHHSARHYLRERGRGSSLTQMVDLVAAGFGFPVVLVNILDRSEQHTIATHGGILQRLPRHEVLCDLVVSGGRTVVMEDIPGGHPLGPELRSYVGTPLRGREGVAVGSLCMMDTRPRSFGAERTGQLEDVAKVVQDQLEVLRALRPDAGSPADALELGLAVTNGQITAHYQPVVDLRTGATTGWEALARWDHPERGLLPPSAFLPLAEDTELVVDLDLAVLEQACAALGGRLRADPDLRLAVNLSPRHLEHPDCVDRLHRTVAEAGVHPGSVVFEVTETAALVAHPHDRDFLDDLRGRGFGLLLDDFGTGFSSVEHVLRLPVDGFKVDRSVTSALHTRTGAVVARALAEMAEGLQLQTVIEGVETAEQAAAALRLGYTRAQGYLWSAPVPADALE